MPTEILIVDDDPVQRRLLEAAVAELGHPVVDARRWSGRDRPACGAGRRTASR